MESIVLWWVFAIVLAVVIACFAGYSAKVKGYSWGTWFTLGLLFGIFALLVTLGLPKKIEKIIEDGSDV